MKVMLRLPEINGSTDREQLTQIKSYLYQLVSELQFALDGRDDTEVRTVKEAKPKTAAETFNSVKGLIIKSADIVDAYCDEIGGRLKGLYVAQSDFGEYREENELKYKAAADEIALLFADTKGITSSLDEIKELISKDGENTLVLSTDAHIRLGVLEEKESGHSLYGIEIGQTDRTNGEAVLVAFARYTSEGTYLFDENGILTAQIAGGRLISEEAEISSSLRVGGFVTRREPDGSSAERWEGVSL